MLDALKRWLLPEMEAKVESLEARVRSANLQASAAKRSLKEVSGVPINWGEFDYEIADAFKGNAKWTTIAKMLNDPHIKGSLKVNTLPLMNAKWEIKPASDDERDQEIADFVSANLLRRSNDRFGREYWSASSWNAQRLPEILSMLENGFSMFAKSWRPVGGKQVLDRLIWLEPSSVDPKGWIVNPDTDEFEGVLRTYRRTTGMPELQQRIDSENLILYVWDMRGARFEGTPFIRSMYGAWYRKDFVQRMATIWSQKVGAPPPVGFYPQSWADEDAQRFEQFIRELRGTAPTHSYFVGPKGSDGSAADVSYAGAETGDIDRSRSVIEQENAEIAHVGGTKHMLLGETASGARAVGETQQRLEMLQVKAIGEIVCEWETHGVGNLPGLIEELVDRNYRGVSSYPELTVSAIAPGELTETLDSLIAAKAAGLVPDHPNLRRQVVERLGYVLPDDAYELEPVNAAWAPGQQLPPAGEDTEDALPEQDTADQEPEDAKDAALEAFTTTDTGSLAGRLLDPVGQANGRRRPLTRLEAEFVDLAAVEETFRVGETDCAIALRLVFRMAQQELKRRIEDGKISRRSIDTQRRSRFRGIGRAMAEVLPPLVKAGELGAEHVASELERQRRTTALSAQDDPMLPKRTIVAGRVVLKEAVTQFAEEVRLYAQITIEEIWNRLMSDVLAEYVRLTRQGLVGDGLMAEMSRYIDSLSEKPLLDQARKLASVAYNQGRDMALVTAKSIDAATFAVRSGILDKNICDPCADIDGTVVTIGSPEYVSLMPPARCLGKERCRCLFIGVAKELEGGVRTVKTTPEYIQERYPHIDFAR